jgi:hypothetical protein
MIPGRVAPMLHLTIVVSIGMVVTAANRWPEDAT